MILGRMAENQRSRGTVDRQSAVFEAGNFSR
jgi:hypothetical protein